MKPQQHKLRARKLRRLSLQMRRDSFCACINFNRKYVEIADLLDSLARCHEKGTCD